MTTHARDLKGLLLGLHVRTSLHAGSGTSVETVDLPIQREKHTHWPMIQGSSIKGVLRDACREHLKSAHGGDRDKTNREDEILTAMFGPGKGGVEQGSNDDKTWAGALAVTDARTLAFPVRSLKGVFAYVTCPDALRRLKQDADIAGVPIDVDQLAIDDKGQNAIAADDITIRDSNQQRLMLEEFDFDVIANDALLNKVANIIATLAGAPPTNGEQVPGATWIKKHLAILSGTFFTHYVSHATEITARIALNYHTKTVDGGALFYQEFLPPETILYSILLADDSRRPGGKKMSKDEILDYLSGKNGSSNHLPKFLQIGGDETIGKGICAIRAKGAN